MKTNTYRIEKGYWENNRLKDGFRIDRQKVTDFNWETVFKADTAAECIEHLKKLGDYGDYILINGYGKTIDGAIELFEKWGWQ